MERRYRYKRATQLSPEDEDRTSELYSQSEEIQAFREEVDDLHSLDEFASDLVHKAQDIARKYPDLKNVYHILRDAAQDYNMMMRDVDKAMDELHDAEQRRDDERDEILERYYKR